MAEPLTWENVVPELLDRIPELRPIEQRLLDWWGPPVEPFGFMQAAVAHGVAQVLGERDGDLATSRDAEPLRRLMAALEELETSDDPYLKDLMGTGFVENMHPAGPCFESLVALMGPASRRVAVAMFPPPWQQGQRPRSEDNSERN